MTETRDELTKSERIFVRIALLQTVLAAAGASTKTGPSRLTLIPG